MSKRPAVVVLVGLNLFLLAALVLSSYSPPSAYAQRGGRPGDYMMATAQIHSDYDALVIVDVQLGAMYVFVPREVPGGAKLAWTCTRNLNHDFGRR